MSKRKISDVVLVYDSYYRDKPNAVALILKRILLCCGVNLCALMYIIHIYQLGVNDFLAGVICILASIFFSLLFVFVKKRFAILGLMLIVGLVIWRIGEPFWEKLSLFWDKILLIMDGRFFNARFFLNNNISYLDPRYLAYQSSELLGVIFLISIFSLITAACLFNKIHPMPMIAAWFVLWIPTLVGEKLYLSLWLIPSFALYIAVIAMSISYSQSLAIGSGVTSYHAVVKNNEASFIRRTAKQPYTTKALNRHGYYSKYYSLGVYLFSVFSIVGILSSILLRGSDGLDYTKLYNFVNSIGSKVQENKPFENGALSDYFTKSPNSVNFRNSTLGISSPGQSNQEILRVTNSGDLPVYLRGDIGIDFMGNSWTSPVNTDRDHRLWTDTELASRFRPAELNALSEFLDYYYGTSDVHAYGLNPNLIQSLDVNVNYLCETNVAFLPAYATDFGFYENEMFDIYGDYVARANNKYETVNSLNFTALVPSYTNVDALSGDIGLSVVESVNYELQMYSNELDECFDTLCGITDAYSQYYNYVNRSYLNVPNELVEPLQRFINENNLVGSYSDYSDEYAKYSTAVRIADFLRENYTYSLSAPIDTNNPILSFLNDVKSGHCALYASSLTLLLRELGIPARYCTGFVAQPSGGEPQILRSKNLHAWCEVYLGRLGWVTFDPTSAAATGDIGDFNLSIPDSLGNFSAPQISLETSFESVQSDENSSNNSSNVSESDDQPSYGEESDSGVNPLDQNTNALPFILGISGILIVVGVVVLVIYRYKKLGEDAQRALKGYSKSNNADLLLKKIHDVMRVCGLAPARGELPEKFYMRADKSLGCAIYSNHEVLEAAAFGSVERSDCRALSKLLENLYNYAERESKLPNKIRLWIKFVKN